MKIKFSFSGLTKNSFLLSFASLFSDISTEMLYPILPIFLTQTLGVSAEIVGLIEGIAVSSQNIVQGFSGYFSDKLQRHKNIAIAGYILAAISKPCIGIATIWPEALAGRFFDRLGAGIRTAPRDALIAGSVDTYYRGKAFGLEGIGDNLGAFLGPLITVLLLFMLHVNIRPIFYLTIIPGFCSVIMILLIKEKQMVVKAKAKLDLSFKQFPASYWKYLFVTAVFGLGNASTVFLILRTKDLGVSLITTIFVYALFNFVAAAVSYPAGSLSDRFGRKTLLLFAFCMFLITYLGFAVSTNLWLIAILFIGYGIFSGMYRAVGKAFAVDFVDQKFRASAVGWYATVVGLTTLIASSIVGEIWTVVAPQAAFVYSAVFACLGILTLSLCIKKSV